MFLERQMKSSVYIHWFALPQLRLPVIAGAILLGSFTAAALPEPGTPAPPLQFTQLLQAPPGAKADWVALRGKVVVLEFGGTDCGPCIVEIPHLNRISAALDPAKFQFISVYEEDPEVVQRFLTKRKISGWAGIDTTNRVFKRFGVMHWPMTIIVDGQGRVVASTSPENLTAVDLRAVSDGKSVKLASAEDESAAKGEKVSAATAKAPATAIKPLYEVSLSKQAPGAGPVMMSASAGPGHMSLSGWSAERVLRLAYGVAFNEVPKDRLLPTSSLPEGRYNLHAIWSSEDSNGRLIAPFIQESITYGLNLRVQWKTVTKKAYVLRMTEASKNLLIPQPPIEMSFRSYKNGKLKLVDGSIDDLAAAIEDGLEVPVVNETGIEGRFDTELEFPAKDADAAKAALLKTLGLELIETDRPIQMLEVSPREDSKKAMESKPQEAPKK
ncbi:MAG: redoxin domain-containing protein [Terracidiphilus sp.]